MIIKALLYTIALLLLQCCLVMAIIAQQQNGPYNWPLKPGMPEWKELEPQFGEITVQDI